MRRLIIILIITLFPLSFAFSAFASEPNYPDFIKSKSVARSASNPVVKGKIPTISNLSNYSLQTLLNQEIARVYSEKFDAAKKANAKSIEFSYVYKSYQDYHSVIVYNNTLVSGTVREEASTVVFRFNSPRPLTINDVLGISGSKLISLEISNIIKQNPSKYNSNFAGVSENQSFYLEDGQMAIVFDKYLLGPINLGMPVFRFRISDFEEFVIGRNLYYSKEIYNLKMIPLRMVCEALDFTVIWRPESQTIEVKSHDFTAVMATNRNSYTQDKYPNRTLESAPEIREGVTYVPISFFDTLINVAHTTELNGNITFSAYHGRILEP